MSEKQKIGQRSTASRLLRVSILAVLIVLALLIGAGLEPLTRIVSEIIASSTPIPTGTPTSTPTATITNSPTSTPTSLINNSPQLSYAISLPGDLSVKYSVRTNSGSLSWSKSTWIPFIPARSSNITYEVGIVYSNRSFGPYSQTATSRRFSNLDVQENQQLKFRVTAVGTVRVGQYAYEFRSKTAEYNWVRPTSTPTNTQTSTFTPSPTPTRLPSSHPRLAYSLSAPSNIQSAFTSLGGLRVEWSGAKWSPGKPDDWNTFDYKVTVLNPNGAKGETQTTRGTSIDFRSAARYKSRQVTFRVEAVGTIRIDGHEYEIRGGLLEGAPLYVPSYDYVLETDTSWNDNLPGYCDIRLILKRRRDYGIEVVYKGDTYEWYRVELYDFDGNKLDISSTRRVGSGNSREYQQRYEGTMTLKPGVYTASARELSPSRRKTFAFVLNAQGVYSVQVGGFWC